MQSAKPCADCSCGLKEKLEGNTTVTELENGNTESSCGKCYLGDAFRCASCPYRGLAAFEKGDKVKLVNSDTAQQNNLPQDRVQVLTTGGSKKVMLNAMDDDMDF